MYHDVNSCLSTFSRYASRDNAVASLFLNSLHTQISASAALIRSKFYVPDTYNEMLL